VGLIFHGEGGGALAYLNEHPIVLHVRYPSTKTADWTKSSHGEPRDCKGFPHIAQRTCFPIRGSRVRIPSPASSAAYIRRSRGSHRYFSLYVAVTICFRSRWLAGLSANGTGNTTSATVL